MNTNTKPAKTTGLAAFSSKRPTPETPSIDDTQASNPEARKRGKGDLVALTVRLKRQDWERCHQLAVSEGTSLQQLAVDGLSLIFAKKGLPELDS